MALAEIAERRFAAAVIVTDHDDLDYDAILDQCRGGGRQPQCLCAARRRRREDCEGVREKRRTRISTRRFSHARETKRLFEQLALAFIYVNTLYNDKLEQARRVR
ncbi:hypothetical protein [Methylosinus sp. Sm6]|uniref:hypothetical protein n=1 Tax=Methylosinus sp. Sm6 TaxID=2866948 RepID=UPI001C98FD7B|nr:hypothetical protein [Methylosinus sp. Sm6]MBY6242685.1 hypothetical protein [Methylosinus sp. Sm6]